MAFLKLMVFSAVAIILASSKKGGKKGGGLRSLTALVEQQTKKISEITSLVDEAKKEINELKASVEEGKEEINDLKSKIESLKETCAEELKASVDEGKEEINDLKSKIESLKETCAEELKARKNDVMVVSGEEDLREERCAKVCAGSSVSKATNWEDFSYTKIYTRVDISKCGFVTIPTVTSSLEGSMSFTTRTGSSYIYRVTSSYFRIYLVSPYGRGGVANKMGWNVEWIAVGYTC
ncbi:uncharacterized protein LOC134821976 [Bolinopsis microptera]|uniref:uncharacterized protein LOC134821976 n=1 Tax=Bolinopsis microptera TaxID=2820187 RepID=UPI003079F8F2